MTARLIWNLAHLISIVGAKNRFFIFFNGAENDQSYGQSFQLIICPEN